MPLFYISNRAVAALYSTQEVEQVPARCRCGMQFNMWLRYIFRVLFLFIYHILVQLLSLAIRYKVILIYICHQRTFITIYLKRPRVLRIGCSTPGTVLPYTIQIII